MTVLVTLKFPVKPLVLERLNVSDAAVVEPVVGVPNDPDLV